MIPSKSPFSIRLRDGSTTTTHVVVGHSYRGSGHLRYRLSTGDFVDAEHYEIVPSAGDLPPLCDECCLWLGRHRDEKLRLCENCWEQDALATIEWHTSRLNRTLSAAVRNSAHCWVSIYVAPGGPDHTSELPLIQSFGLWLEQISKDAVE